MRLSVGFGLGLFCELSSDGSVRLYKKDDWDDNPHTVEEYQINPQEDGIGGIEVLVVCKPLWCKCHPTSIQFSCAKYNLPKVSCSWIVLYDLL
jgi:hypothetical protein